ncbi:MAG: TIGR03557 family F420-dependent LLM class oxidoreductase [Ilumatobacteraceae bacterium]
MSDDKPVTPSSVRLGWWLSGEEHGARQLVEHALLAESTGFPTAMISDHLQPWVRHQGHAGHVWTTLGAIAHATDGIEVGTGVTAMVHRSHPIDVAHAAATAAVLFEGRFFLGVGSGERLNEQPYGQRWPRAGERREQMREAIEVLRQLWQDENVNHRGDHFAVEHLRLMERPASPPPIHVATSGKRSAALAGELGDGMIAVEPDATLIDAYRGAGGKGPCIAQLHLSLAATMDDAMDNAWEWWPNGAVAPALLSELARPQHFEAVAETTQRDAITKTVICATDVDPVVQAIDRYVGAGFDTVYLHQAGPDQQRLADLAGKELLPHYQAAG